ncbi:MAG: hypothetical protein ACXVA9_07845, partial [Bdellovibrionales bacterium]
MKLLLILFGACVSFAYIPEYSLIASRTADTHGKGSYLIEQYVTFHKESEEFTVKETWLINGESSMRVTLEGRGPLKGLVQGSMVYEGSQKFFIEPSGTSPRAQRLGDDWLEPLFHFRNSKFFRSRLVGLKVAPAESVHDRAALPSEGDIKYEPPGFVRLSRVGGTVAWAIGLPPSSGANHPEVWIEQDQFVVRKYRGLDQVVVKANDYNKFDDGLYFPRQRTYQFGAYTVE